ncbi:hypothetical protein [Acidithiobacillus sp. 'AMD consortium']|uniref:hypothetical protein n=1 Tax=Acidithiobacillus sp. 'AMD consortium' TaxID=2614801 RepID=UPI00178C1BC0|nr:hypothetical protein [Acidithiobacillus sp. 'AMD consortium']
MKSLDIEQRLDQIGLKESVLSIAVVLACDTISAIVANPWGYTAVLTAAGSLTFWFFHS